MKALPFMLLLFTTTFINPLPVFAKQVDVVVALSTPIMAANKTQTAFLKISLTGFDITHPSERIPANVAIVLDRSGSMQGEKLARAKEAAIVAINAMNANDIVSVLTYDSVVNVIVPSSKVSDKLSIIQKIQNIRAGGNTALFAGVSKGAAEVRKFLDKEHVNRIILLSDGIANVGPSSPTELGQLGMSLAKERISVSTIGLGSGYNEDLMTQLAGYSDGNHAFVENATDLATVFKYEFGDVFSVVAQDVDITITCQPGIKPVRVLGRDAEISQNTVTLHLNQIYSVQEKFVLMEVEVPPHQAGTQLALAAVDISYDNMFSKQRDKLNAPVQVAFSASQQAVTQATNKTVMESAVSQIADDMSKQAIEFRDKGQIKEARSILKKSADYLQSNANAFGSSKLERQQQEVLQDAQELTTKDWRVQRKALKAKQYRRERQQNF